MLIIKKKIRLDSLNYALKNLVASIGSQVHDDPFNGKNHRILFKIKIFCLPNFLFKSGLERFTTFIPGGVAREIGNNVLIYCVTHTLCCHLPRFRVIHLM